MLRQDSVDFLTAFAVGTVLGIGTTLLLQPRPTPKERVVRKLKPYRKQMRKSYRNARSAVREGTDATSEMTGELVGAGRELLSELSSEVFKILVDARNDLQAQTKDLSKGVRQTRKRYGV